MGDFESLSNTISKETWVILRNDSEDAEEISSVEWLMIIDNLGQVAWTLLSLAKPTEMNEQINLSINPKFC